MSASARDRFHVKKLNQVRLKANEVGKTDTDLEKWRLASALEGKVVLLNSIEYVT